MGPIACHITFTTYGTWLHGDKRGSVDKEHNSPGSDFVAPSGGRMRNELYVLKNLPVILNQNQREAVLKAVLQVCEFRGWIAHAVHVRSNHVHVVVSGVCKLGKMMTDFKAYATRAIKNCGSGHVGIKKYWTEHGSTKYLWTQEKLASTIEYVKYEQGEMMAFGGTNIKPSPERQ